MSFNIELNEFQQNINLSYRAFKIIFNDMFEFSNTKENIHFSTFLNTVLTNFIEKSNTSINITLLNCKTELKNKGFTNQYIDEYLVFLKKKLIFEFENRIKRKKFINKNYPGKFRINIKNINLLNEISEPYDPIKVTLGMYLKGLYEEYSDLNKCEREKIYFNEKINLINLSIANKCSLKIVLNSYGNKEKAIMLVRPYKIVHDELNSKNYLICITQLWDKELHTWKEDKLISSLRITRIAKIDLQLSISNFISEDLKQQIEKELATKGPEFMLGKIETIKVKFDEEGLRLLKVIQYNRPSEYEKMNDYVYIFRCTAYHAKLYFLRFLQHAEIISPKFIKDEIKQDLFNFIQKQQNK